MERLKTAAAAHRCRYFRCRPGCLDGVEGRAPCAPCITRPNSCSAVAMPILRVPSASASPRLRLREQLPEWSDAEFEAYARRHYPGYWLKSDERFRRRHAALSCGGRCGGRGRDGLRDAAFRGVTEITGGSPAIRAPCSPSSRLPVRRWGIFVELPRIFTPRRDGARSILLSRVPLTATRTNCVAGTGRRIDRAAVVRERLRWPIGLMAGRAARRRTALLWSLPGRYRQFPVEPVPQCLENHGLDVRGAHMFSPRGSANSLIASAIIAYLARRFVRCVLRPDISGPGGQITRPARRPCGAKLCSRYPARIRRRTPKPAALIRFRGDQRCYAAALISGPRCIGKSDRFPPLAAATQQSEP